MIKTTGILIEELKEYSNPNAKIKRLVQNGSLFPIVRGIYETNPQTPGHFLAALIYGPSYLSFEFALAYYSLIPEAVYVYTSATFEKSKKKEYDTPFGKYIYRSVPSHVYPLGLILHREDGYGFQIASPAKAICDMLYTLSPVKNRQELRKLLFDDLRIDEAAFSKIDHDEFLDIARQYQTSNHKLLVRYLQRRFSK